MTEKQVDSTKNSEEDVEEELQGEEQVNVMINALKSSQMIVRSSAINKLVDIGKPAVSQLLDVLDDEYWTVRFGAVEALGEIGDQKAVPHLIKYLSDKDHEFRAKVAEALGLLEAKKAVSELKKALFDELNDVREQAALALGKIGDKNATNALMKAINDESPYVRRAVATAMGKIQDKSTETRLIQALKDKNAPVKQAVVKALGQIKGKDSVVPLIRTFKDPSATPEVKQEVETALKAYEEDVIVGAIENHAEDNKNEQIQLFDELLFHCPELDTVSAIKEERQEKLVKGYERMLRRKTSEINAVVAFVQASFKRMPTADDPELEMIKKSLARNRTIIEETDLKELKSYPWIHNTLYFSLSKAEDALKEGRKAIKELDSVIENKMSS